MIAIAHAHSAELAARAAHERAWRRLEALSVSLWRLGPPDTRTPWLDHAWRLHTARVALHEATAVLWRSIRRHQQWYSAYRRCRGASS